MARKRMIDPEFWLDEELALLSPYARLLYIGLWGICDDNFATLPYKSSWIKAQVFPYNNDINIESLIRELIDIGKVLDFSESGNRYLYIKNLFKYQRIDKPSAPKYPKYQAALGEPSANPLPEVKGSEAKLSKDNISRSEALEFNKKLFEYNKELTGMDFKDEPKDRQKYPRLIRNKFKDLDVVQKTMYWAWNQRRKSDGFYYWREGRMTLAKLYFRLIPDFLSKLTEDANQQKLYDMRNKLTIKSI